MKDGEKIQIGQCPDKHPPKVGCDVSPVPIEPLLIISLLLVQQTRMSITTVGGILTSVYVVIHPYIVSKTKINSFFSNAGSA
jgi:hypothetical protein